MLQNVKLCILEKITRTKNTILRGENGKIKLEATDVEKDLGVIK